MQTKVEQLELKPCPFCGGTASSSIREDYNGVHSDKYVKECDDCGSETRECKTREEATELWNRRAEPTAPDKYEGLKRRLLGECDLRDSKNRWVWSTKAVRDIIAEVDALAPAPAPFSCNTVCRDCGLGYNMAHNPKGCPVCTTKPAPVFDSKKQKVHNLLDVAINSLKQVMEETR